MANKHDKGMTSCPQSTKVREKAAYVRAARRKMNRMRGRKFDIESEIINALAVGRLGDRTTTEVLDARFDKAYLQVATKLDQLRKASPFEWRPRRGSVESALQEMKQSVVELETRLLERNH